MGRKKSQPVRARGLGAGIAAEPDAPSPSRSTSKSRRAAKGEARRDVCVEVDNSTWHLVDGDRRDLAELVIRDVRLSGEGKEALDIGALHEAGREAGFSLRLRVRNAPEEGFRLGQWPVVPSDCVILEYVIADKVITGCFDGPDEGVSGLAHLVSLRFVTLRVHAFTVSQSADFAEAVSFRVRLGVMERVFDACESLLEVARHPWRKSLMNMMSWVRPEVMTSAAIYGMDGSVDWPMDDGGNSDSTPKKDSQFDLDAFYEAVKPSTEAGLLKEELPDLLPHLRPYQLRAANWMVQREKGNTMDSLRNQQDVHSAPYCVPIDFMHKNSRMFYNPFNGNLTLHPEPSPPYVSGGILADEMGLGKTVELLACIFAHRRPYSADCSVSSNVKGTGKIKRQKRERVECICGAASVTSAYKGIWIQCDICDAWQHASCVGYSPKVELHFSDDNGDGHGNGISTMKSKIRRKKKDKYSIAETEENYICTLCLDLIEATQTNICSHATLIICPSPILAQWHSEITRHTRPGSLKVCVYEGARNLDLASTEKIDVADISRSDVVLTSYDVLKEDLSHDSDRYDGDRHFLRYQKRYPVIPTVLTRVHWWRLCLDEAQMVESSKTSVTEMAMRLNAQHRWCITGTPIQRRLDDLFGLLRFLRTSPFDTYRWWVDIIRDPYERGDVIAMNYAHKFFKEIMWRSSKIHVSRELQLPPQEECFSWLIFSSIEEYFYKKQHATCMDHAHDIIRRLRNDANRREPTSDSSALSNVYLSNDDIAKLLVPLLKLRQACCHPQVGSSGLCSLQRTPLSMGEILQVLIGKAKVEGEEELRKIIVALNGLAGIAVIEQKNQEAISLYKEALSLAHENFDDFRVDPLLNLHINHNLAELLRTSSEYLQRCPLKKQTSEVHGAQKRKEISPSDLDLHGIKRNRICENGRSSLITDNLETSEEEKNITTQVCATGEVTVETDAGCHSSSECLADGCLRKTCNAIREKYLSVFTSKLIIAQKDFSASFTEVSTHSEELQSQNMNWWLYSLDCIEQNKDSADELIRKIEISSTKSTTGLGSTRLSSRVHTVAGLKYYIQAGIDSLQISRKKLMKRLLEVDKTMDNPRDEDIECQRYCPNCYDGTGSLCIQCELDELFQGYEARLFLVKKSNNDSVIASVEEAQDLHRRKYELNQFFRNNKTNEGSEPGDDKNQRSARENIQVYRHPSQVETSLRVIRTHSKTIMGKQYAEIAKRHLLLFEAMRKEFSQARNLSIAQSQLLRAHDEIKMSLSRLQLKENDDEPSAVNVVTREELIPYNVQFTSDKFLSLSSLARIRGQLRYLKGLVLCNKKTLSKHGASQPKSGNSVAEANSFPVTGQTASDISDEPCPICQEKIFDQKMVFQCGHFVCCKCCLYMTEQTAAHFGRSKRWIMCPNCRQRTDLENVAFVVENQRVNADEHVQDLAESAISVQGSYGTKIESVTRRILRITSSDEAAKVLVFSSWNDVLDVLEHSLTANNVSYVRMKGGRKSQAALSQFKGLATSMSGQKAKKAVSKMQPAQVLLMLIQHGANGLNLLEAQHVLLVEPLLNPAAEAQAISRIHRVGQDKNTFIHRFIVKNTIEESIYKLNRGRAVCSTIHNKSKKFKDELIWTLKDIESLFPVAAPDQPSEQENKNQGEHLRSLPSSAAAGLAAERRLFTERHYSQQ